MNKKLIIIGGALVGVLGAGGAGVYFFKPDLLPESIRPQSAEGDKHTKNEKAEAEKKKELESEVGADLEVFVVNLAADGGPQRYLRTTLSLGVKDTHEKEKIKEFAGPIRHAVIMYLTELKAAELVDPEGKNKIREALHKQINEAIGEKMVSNIYFKEFLIQ